MVRRGAAGATLVLTICALFTGAALLAAVLLHLSLALTLGILGAFAVALATLALRIVPVASRRELAVRAAAGAAGGALGVGLYDGVRLGIVSLGHLRTDPFAAVPFFGALITGADPHSHVASDIGLVYHYANGVFFGVSFGIALGRRSWWWGIPWALALELLMLTIYPGWLKIGPAMMEEFTVVSLSGHLAYGTGLGVATTALVRRFA